LIRSLGAVPIDRERGGLGGIKATLQLLKAGEAVLVFPEGTRSRDGRLQPLMPGFCTLARRGGATVVPVAIDGAFAAMPRGSRFPRPWPIRLTFCRAILPDEQMRLSDEELAELVAELIAAELAAREAGSC
jgi:1-acyl-sn-glycerol-3-phosphate acyltransferase